jgi:hypothetical protein
LDVCYRCGKRLYSPDRCPYCGLTFCEEHMPSEKHKCIAVAQEKGQKRNRLFSLIEVAAFLLLAGVIWWFVNRNH